jgi:hypothetical protein
MSPAVLEERWSHLHRFLHPGSREQAGWLAMACAELDISDHKFLSCRAKNFGPGGSVKLLLRYDLVDSILEVVSHTTQLGFLRPEDFPEKLAAE